MEHIVNQPLSSFQKHSKLLWIDKTFMLTNTNADHNLIEELAEISQYILTQILSKKYFEYLIFIQRHLNESY